MQNEQGGCWSMQKVDMVHAGGCKLKETNDEEDKRQKMNKLDELDEPTK